MRKATTVGDFHARGGFKMKRKHGVFFLFYLEHDRVLIFTLVCIYKGNV